MTPDPFDLVDVNGVQPGTWIDQAARWLRDRNPRTFTNGCYTCGQFDCKVAGYYAIADRWARDAVNEHRIEHGLPAIPTGGHGDQ